MRVAYVGANPDEPVFGPDGGALHVQEMVAALRRCGALVEIVERIPGPTGDAASRLAVNAALEAALTRRGPFDLVYQRFSPWSYAGMEHARQSGAAGLLEVDGHVDRMADEGMAVRAFRAASAVVAVSRPLGEWLEGLPQARGRVHVVPNAVDPARFPAGLRPSRPASSGIFTVGVLGGPKPWRGLEVLAEAYARVCEIRPAFRLLVVGEGPGAATLEAALAARGVRGDVEVTGAVARAEVPGLLASMDAAIAPDSEPDLSLSPLEVYECMAAGLPVVASRLGPLEETIRDGVTGLLCPPGDSAAFATALLDLADKPRLRVTLGQAARRAVLAEHTWVRRAERILELARTPATALPARAETAALQALA